MENITKTSATKKAYYNRACLLMIKALRESNLEDHKFSKKTVILKYLDEQHVMMDIKYVAVWATSYWAGELLQSSWRQYRASILYMAELFNSNSKLSDEDFEKIKSLLLKARGRVKAEMDERRTSSTKKKSINSKEVKELDESLKLSSSTWSNPLRLWIRAGKDTGLRPIEWKDAKYYKSENVLVVKNAKNTNGRSFGKYRTINLSHLSKEQVKDIDLHLQISNNMIKKKYWDKYYKACSNLLRYMSRKIWTRKSRYPTLYSCRHQFSANMKASGCTKVEVAALMGHASDLTAQEHYGRKVNGSRGRKPVVNKSEMDKVKMSEKPKFKFEK